MANRDPKASYRELGEFLKQKRQQKFRSALEFFRQVEFSFSYSLYADFEKGVALPSIDMMLELAKYFGIPEAEAAILWAKVQMPNGTLKQVFTFVPTKYTEEKKQKHIDESPDFENTWVFGPQELKVLKKTPELWDLCLLLAQSYPEEIAFSEIHLNKGTFKDWIRSGHLTMSKKGVALQCQHIYLPRTQEWDEVRRNNIKRASSDLLANISARDIQQARGYREIIHRQLSAEQIEQIVTKLKTLEAEFKTIPYSKSKDSQNQMQALILILGKRSLKGGGR